MCGVAQVASAASSRSGHASTCKGDSKLSSPMGELCCAIAVIRSGWCLWRALGAEDEEGGGPIRRSALLRRPSCALNRRVPCSFRGPICTCKDVLFTAAHHSCPLCVRLRVRGSVPGSTERAALLREGGVSACVLVYDQALMIHYSRTASWTLLRGISMMTPVGRCRLMAFCHSPSRGSLARSCLCPNRSHCRYFTCRKTPLRVTRALVHPGAVARLARAERPLPLAHQLPRLVVGFFVSRASLLSRTPRHHPSLKIC